MNNIDYCINDDCKNIATSNIIENKLTRCDLHKIDDNAYNKTINYIKRFREIHSNKYDYYKTLYTHQRTKVIITCKIHGDFLTRTDIHLSGHNCKKCIDKSSNRNNTTEQFIKIARKKHGDKYDYSKVKYIDYNTTVIIICPLHGEYNQRPEQHLARSGCTKCGYEKGANNNKLTTDKFIERAIEIHCNKYDYSKVDYRGWENKVIIICPIHKEFEQMAGSHLCGKGCISCSNENKFINYKDQFISNANNVHSNKYDYSLIDYINTDTKIIIICPIHNKFTQTPKAHINGQGCPRCGIESAHNLQKKSNDEFIKQCKDKHGDTFDYSKVQYTTCKDDIIIICRKHGEFTQNASVHLKGHGCKKCHDEQMSIDRRFSVETVINNAKRIHGDKYDYSLIEYINNSTPFKIICHQKYKDGTEHGIFLQSYQCHVAFGCGCTRCSLNGFSKSQIEWLEFLMTKLQINIINIKNEKEHRIIGSFKLADGYCKELNTIFEYDGCYFHGCPKCFTNRDLVNTRCKKTFKELYDRTIEKHKFCKEKGYKYISIWECEWKYIKNNQNKACEYIQSLKNILNIPATYLYEG
jgi:hypothetical protein